MNMNMKNVILILFLLLMTVLVTAKDVPGIKMLYKYHTDAMMRRPAEDSQITYYASDEGVYSEIAGAFSFLFLSKDSKFYLVYHDKKEFSPVDMAKLKSTLELMDTQLGEVIIEEKVTGKKGKVGQWNTYEKLFKAKCKQFEFESNIEFTTDISPLYSMDRFWQGVAEFQGRMGKFTRAILKSEGYPVKFTSKLLIQGQTVNSSTLAASFEKTKIPAHLFMLPKDYKEVPLNMQDFQKAFY